MNIFFQHTEDEAHFFHLLVQKGRAGSPELLHYYEEQIRKVRESAEDIKNIVRDSPELRRDEEALYFSSWLYSAVDVLSLLPSYGNAQKISERLNISVFEVQRILEFLQDSGLLKREEGRFVSGQQNLHLKNTSPYLPGHHRNWRIKCLENLNELKKEDLHYSVLVGISKEDFSDFRRRLLELIREFDQLVSKSKEEEPYVFCLDWFRL